MLRIKYRMQHRPLSKAMGPGGGPLGRITRLRKIVTAIIRHERLEGKFDYLNEARGYVELLVQHAHRHGNQHQETMELVDYWLLEKDLIPKLFEVLVPRYSHSPAAVTRLMQLPKEYPGSGAQIGVIELKGNPWPPLVPKERDLSGSLVNVLLDAARKEKRQHKYAEISKTLAEGGVAHGDSCPRDESLENAGTTEDSTPQTDRQPLVKTATAEEVAHQPSSKIQSKTGATSDIISHQLDRLHLESPTTKGS